MTDALEAILPHETQELARDFLRRACDADVKLATAESCTGGLLAAILTDVEGCSHAFDRGFVTYDAQAKCDMLGLSEDIVERNAAVNEAVATGMAEAAIRQSSASIAVGITGFAGQCSDDQEEGLVFIGCAAKGQPTACREEHFGALGRDAIRRAALRSALEMMDEALDAIAEKGNA